MFDFLSSIPEQTVSENLVSVFSPHLYPHIHSLNFRNLTSELHPSAHVATTIIKTVAISTVFLVSVAANVGAVVLVTCERRLLSDKTILTLNLFVADLLFVSMILMIVTVRWTVSWELGYAACYTVLYVICMSGCVAITTLASISGERVQAILWLQTVPAITLRIVTATLIFIWAFSALTSLPLSLFFTQMEVDFPKQTNVVTSVLSGGPTQQGRFTALFFLLSGLIILDMKFFCTMLVLVLFFLITRSPFFIIIFLILARNLQGHIYVSSTMFFWVVTFTLASSALNPTLYAVCQFKNSWCSKAYMSADL